MARMDGIDVSKWQREINWPAVRAAGVNWTACRASLGASTNDPFLPANRAGMDANGFRTKMFYHWITPGSSVKAQVDWFFRQVGSVPPGWGVMLDVEQDGVNVQLSDAWCRAVEGITGRKVVVYSGLFVDGGRIIRWARDSGRPFVLASYNSETWTKNRVAGQGISWDMIDAWQWTGSGQVPGVNGSCDIDQIHNWGAFDAACGISHSVPQPVPQPPPQPQPAPPRLPAFPPGQPVLKRTNPMMRDGRGGVGKTAIHDLQHLINAFKYHNLKVDGVFGDQTEMGVKVAQRSLGQGLAVDGQYGPETARVWRETFTRFLNGLAK